MSIESIIKDIDGELSKLTKVKQALQPLIPPIVPAPPSKHRVKTGEHSSVYVMDAAARERMSKAQRARWAKVHDEKEATIQQGIKEAKRGGVITSPRQKEIAPLRID